MELTSIILAWSALALAVTMSPGPDMAVVAGQAGRRGVRAGLAAAGGVVAGGIFYIALCGFGFLTLLTASPTLFLAVRIAGALYLAWIGFSLLRGAISPEPQVSMEKAPMGAPFRQGLFTNVLNPKVALFYLAALPQFTGNGPDAPFIGALLVAIHYAMGGALLSAIAFGVGRAGAAVRRTAWWRALEGLAGAFLITIAGKLALERN